MKCPSLLLNAKSRRGSRSVVVHEARSRADESSGSGERLRRSLGVAWSRVAGQVGGSEVSGRVPDGCGAMWSGVQYWPGGGRKGDVALIYTRKLYWNL